MCDFFPRDLWLVAQQMRYEITFAGKDVILLRKPLRV